MESEIMDLQDAFKKSTNVRPFYHQAPRWIRVAFRLGGALSPSLAAKLATRLFFTTQRRAASRTGAEALARGRRVKAGQLAVWSWGDGPVVLLVHGWNGRASQLSRFIEPLVDRGYRVVAFDAPAHGESPGKQTTIPEMVGALQQVSAELGEIHGVIAHSMGGAATLLAITEGLDIERAVLIAPPSDPALFVTHFARALGLSQELERRLRVNIERRAGRRLEELRVDRLTPRRPQPLLVIHDEDDSQVPIEHGVSIVETWPNASLVATRGLGHRRILGDAYVNKRSVGFIDAPLRADRTAA